jgi:hypothetical protein
MGLCKIPEMIAEVSASNQKKKDENQAAESANRAMACAENRRRFVII